MKKTPILHGNQVRGHVLEDLVYYSERTEREHFLRGSRKQSIGKAKETNQGGWAFSLDIVEQLKALGTVKAVAIQATDTGVLYVAPFGAFLRKGFSFHPQPGADQQHKLLYADWQPKTQATVEDLVSAIKTVLKQE